jgi:hypothetical protein
LFAVMKGNDQLLGILDDVIVRDDVAIVVPYPTASGAFVGRRATEECFDFDAARFNVHNAAVTIFVDRNVDAFLRCEIGKLICVVDEAIHEWRERGNAFWLRESLLRCGEVH